MLPNINLINKDDYEFLKYLSNAKINDSIYKSEECYLVSPKFEYTTSEIENYFEGKPTYNQNRETYLRYENHDGTATHKVLIIGDSYTYLFKDINSMVANNFYEYTFIRHEDMTNLDYYIEQTQPDIIIYEVAERMMYPSITLISDFLVKFNT